MKRARKMLLLRIGLASVAILAAFFAIYVAYLDRVVTQQFEGRRWTLPAQVFAQPIDLYVGQSISGAVFEQELKRLGYQQAAQADRPGTYRRRGNRFDFMSRRVQFWDETRDPQLIAVTLEAGTVSALEDGAGAEVPIFRLDPLLIGSIFPIHGEDRVVLTPEEIPPMLPAALKIVEDRKFDSHFGIDPIAILRAMFANLRAGRIVQGGSTLTQQLVKSYFLDSRQTLGRKVEEALMAVILDARFEKTDLMTAYINEIHLGQDGQRAIHGFGLASQYYFGKPLSELQLHEVALLVAVARGPSYYNPRRSATRALERRNLVLQLLAEYEVITPKEAEVAIKRPLGLAGDGRIAAGYYPAFLDFVRRTLRRDYREEDLTEGGLKIFTTLDPLVQAGAESALTAELERLDKARKKQRKESLEGVVVVTAPQSGDVSAMVGGRRVGFDGFNRALDAKRSIGSLVKPVIYLAAVETGRYNAASIVDDSPIEVKLANGQKWRPQNITQETFGPVPVVRALSQSMNLATVHLGMDVGLPLVAQEFTKMGLEKEPARLPALLLGALDVSPLEVAQIYNGLANGGFRTPLRAVRAVVDAQGKPLQAFPLEIAQLADPAAVYQVNRMLVEVMNRGTGRAARARLPPGLVVAGKTGTSSDYRDSWFAGFSGSHLAVVWVGYDDNSPTGLTGSSGALAVWSQLMGSMNTSSLDLFLPETLEEATIEYKSGLRANSECAADVLNVAVPHGATIEQKPGCEGNVLENLGQRIGGFLEGMIRP
ncbi:MAG: penicillin-binding protein 1B [Steroidobacteraceae bacterium]